LTQTPGEPLDECILYPPDIDESHKADFRNLFIEHTRIVSLKNQMCRYTQQYGSDIKQVALRDAARAYRDFCVRSGSGDKVRPLTLTNGKKWFRDRLKWISDRIMEFSDDDAWREKIQMQGKKGKFVLNGEKHDIEKDAVEKDDGEKDDIEKDAVEKDDGEKDDIEKDTVKNEEEEKDDGEKDDGEEDDGKKDDGEEDDGKKDDGEKDDGEKDVGESGGKDDGVKDGEGVGEVPDC
jgi:hypothetical protein